MAPINRVRELREIARKKIEAKKREEEQDKRDKEIDADGLTLHELKRLSPFTGGKNGKGKFYTDGTILEVDMLENGKKSVIGKKESISGQINTVLLTDWENCTSG